MCWFLCTCASPGAAAQPPLSPEAVTPKAAVFHGCSVCRGTPFRAEWCGPPSPPASELAPVSGCSQWLFVVCWGGSVGVWEQGCGVVRCASLLWAARR